MTKDIVAEVMALRKAGETAQSLNEATQSAR